ncbi:MAG: sulfite oxidase [Dehalococcoidia bacterium]|nr:sulfite oxidase [Dehalococcoidia bacterium]MYD27422.1 sulfite oxidase [Dehalococcoidia bacterium]
MPDRNVDDPTSLWTLVQRRGMPRRRFLQLLAAGGATAVLAACGTDTSGDDASAPDGSEAPSPERSGWFKDTGPFIAHADGKSLEARLENMRGLVTPVPLFFVRNNSVSVDVDGDGWQLVVEGDAVSDRVELSYDAIRQLPSRAFISYLECAGNHRAMFDRVQGRPAEGTQWGTGGVGNGEWTGVALRDVLELAGIRENAVSVLLVGLDEESPEEGFRRALPVEKAMHADTLLAYALNGEPLTRDHGYPLRAVIPGWVGAANIKWLGRIIVSSKKHWTRNNTTSYVLIGDDYPPEGEALGQPVTTQTVKSALALPWPADLAPGRQRLQGFAHSPDGPITRVEWSDDSGRTWREASVLEPRFRYSWSRFELVWEARPGEHTIMTRATDASGATQPDTVPFNRKGYLFNQPVPHPIRVG